MSTAERPPDAASHVPRDVMIAKLQSMPADSTHEELLKELAMIRMFDRGLTDLKAGKTIRHEEVGERIATW